MKETTKIMLAGVGGQGVVFLTNVIAEAAVLATIPVATSEIHGLAQRAGSVTAGITLGEHTYGFLAKGSIDFLIGLEPLEAQRCVSYLNKNSRAIISQTKILPYSVNSGHSPYPNIDKFIAFLNENIEHTVYLTTVYDGKKAPLKNLYLLGRLCHEFNFPIPSKFIEDAIRKIVREGLKEESLKAFKTGLNKRELKTEAN